MRTAIFAYEDVLLLNLSGPSEVLATANREVLSTATGGGDGVPYEIVFISRFGGPIATSCGLRVETRPLDWLADMPAHTIFLPGGPGFKTGVPATALAALRPHVFSAQRVVSIGNGLFHLAALGMMDGRKCLTHWRYVEEVQREFPRLDVRSDAVWMRDGKFLTSAGVAAGLDLSLDLVEDDLGVRIANGVARNLVLYVRRSAGQAQISPLLHAQGELDARMRDATTHMSDNFARELRIADIAADVSMTERTFARRFRAACGITPGRFLEKLRVEAAKEMLANTTLGVDGIARRVGLGSGENLARIFRKRLNISPGAYRQDARK